MLLGAKMSTMAATAVQIRFAGFADASPATLREVIVPEDRAQFDAGYREALDAAAQTLTLDKLERFLEHWRRVAWSQHDMGHDRWRTMLADAQRRLAGERPVATVSMEEMDQRIAARLAEGR